MDTEEIGQKLKDFFTKGAQASKEAFEKAGDKVQEFSDKSVVRLEKKQLEGKLDNKYSELGKTVSELISKNLITINDSEEEGKIKAALEEINKLQEEIKQKEAVL